MERRLAAIIAADVVGYSRLMAVDEAGTLARLQRFGDKLTDDQIWAVIEFIKSTWPERQRQFNAQRSQAPE